MNILVKNVIESPIAAFHNDGLAVFSQLEELMKNNEHVTLSFVGITRCSTQFLNASIGKLYLRYTSTVIESLITYNFGEMGNALKSKIDEVRENVLHHQEYDALMESLIC